MNAKTCMFYKDMGIWEEVLCRWCVTSCKDRTESCFFAGKRWSCRLRDKLKNPSRQKDKPVSLGLVNEKEYVEMEDIMKAMVDAGFEPELVEDSSDFSPITGKYVCRIDAAGRKTGVAKKSNEPYDFRSIQLQVAEIIDGDKATNRFLKLTYNPDAEGVKKLLNDLFTAGIKLTAKSDTELDTELEGLKDRTMNIRCWVWTPTKQKDGTPIPEGSRKTFQQIRVVKEFEGKKKADTIKGNVPF